MATEFHVPELGENVDKGDVVRVMVAVGDVIAVDQPVFELETDKATIEVPSSVAGTIAEMKIKEGDKVKAGQLVLTVTEDAKAKSAEAPKSEDKADTSKANESAKPTDDQQEERTEEASEKPTEEKQAKPAPEKKPAEVVNITSRSASASAPAELRRDKPVPAAPSVRRYARELGVDIAQVPGTGPGGRIGQDDVKAYVKAAMTSGGAATGARGYAALADFSKWGSVESKPMSNIRR
ncbi:MAG: E3 binding domain-containing protein, partial [Acidobacteria bacterium]|nr:E3 binding domain-containing protein [Acidobacteriota bacterium]